MLKKHLWFTAPLIAMACSQPHATTIPQHAPCSPKILVSKAENWHQRTMTHLPKGVDGYFFENNERVAAFSLVHKTSNQGFQAQPSIKVPNINHSEFEISHEIKDSCIYWIGIRK
jgi:hypothetical protein